ncbi:MAG: Ig-like domain repeat protein, partial [Vicinamibacteria bacterium]|nr:Ig-like domain repeat protein [Vicinamibacteria bacterium]
MSENEDGTYTARFGYESENADAVEIKVGARNGFTPHPSDRGQPRVFSPGRHVSVFSVDFDGRPLTWTLEGPDGKKRFATAKSDSTRCPAEATCDVGIFGPKTYARTKGWKNVYEATIDVPPEAAPPYFLLVGNGKADAASTQKGRMGPSRCPNKKCDMNCGHSWKGRVSAAWIELNGVEVVGPRDLGHNVSELTREVALSPKTHLKITIAGAPGSFLTIRLCGQGGDTTPPVVTWTEPPPGATIPDPTPRLVVQYQDQPTLSASAALSSASRFPFPEPNSKEGGLRSGNGQPATGNVQSAHGSRRMAHGPCGRCGPKKHCDKPLNPCESTVFGPKEYIRGKGKGKTRYQETLTLPSGVSGPFEIRVKNGGNGRWGRVTAAWISIDGQEIFDPSDFIRTSHAIKREIAFEPGADLVVELAGMPGSRLTIEICASTGSGSEPVASGVDPSTLRVWLDDVERTDLFTKLPEEAFADLLDALALSEGAHRLRATVKDHAGNEGEGVSEFRVDLTPPILQIVEPTNGFCAPDSRVPIRLTYQDNMGLDLGSLRIIVDGEDRTGLFVKDAAGAAAELTLDPGSHTAIASIRDLAGRPAEASTTFIVDVAPPTVTIVAPAPESRHGTAIVAIVVQYADDQRLDLGTLAANVDGASVTLAAGPFEAQGETGALANGWHELTATICDCAGRAATATSRFFVDTTLPEVVIVKPAPGSAVNDATPSIALRYADEDGVDVATLAVRINGVDRTNLFQAGPDGATTELPDAFALAEGDAVIQAEIADITGNVGEGRSAFRVDTLPPTGEFLSPPEVTTDLAPLARLNYSGTGTAVDRSKVGILLDGARDVTSLFTLVDDGAQGALSLDPPLSEDEHRLSLTLADEAGNVNQEPIERVFRVDRTAPAALFTLPAPGAYMNDATPDLRLAYDDPGGTGLPAPAGWQAGVDPSSVRIFIVPATPPDAPETEITAYFAIGETDAEGSIPDSAPLADGTYRLRAELSDRAGNAATTSSSFVLDTVPPTYGFVVPGINAFVGAATPVFEMTYADDRTGVDLRGLELRIDGADLSARLAPEETRAVASLLESDALADGRHEAALKVSDLAGNEAAISPHPFIVDTIPPAVAIASPAPNAVVGSPAVFEVTYQDVDSGAGNAVDLGTVRILIDGIDRAAEFVV